MSLEEAIGRIIELYAISVKDIPSYESKKYVEAIAKVAMSCNSYEPIPLITYRGDGTTLKDLTSCTEPTPETDDNRKRQ